MRKPEWLLFYCDYIIRGERKPSTYAAKETDSPIFTKATSKVIYI